MDSTVVKVVCVSKKESISYNAANPINTAIELQVPYDQSSIYYQMSGGTGIMLQTVNQVAADMFVIGKTYVVTVSPDTAPEA